MPSRKRASQATSEPAPLSARNHRVQRLARLARRRAARHEEQAFVVDGPTLVAEAVTAGADLEALYVAEGAGGTTAALAERAIAAGIDVWSVDPAALARAVDVVTPRPVAAVARQRRTDLADVPTGSVVLVLAGVADPGNAGTLVRTAEASGAGAVMFADESVDPYNPKCVRASAGGVFHVPLVVGGTTVQVLGRLGDAGYRRLTASAENGRPYDEVDLTGSLALVLGNEAHGLPDGLEPWIDGTVTIPMVGRSESLNVAMAGSVLCFEASRQRRVAARERR